jgi:hypothetical protein
MVDSRTMRVAFIAALFVAAGCAANNLATAPNSQQSASQKRLSAPLLHPPIGFRIPLPPSHAAIPHVYAMAPGYTATPYPTFSIPPPPPTPIHCTNGGEPVLTVHGWLCLYPWKGVGLGSHWDHVTAVPILWGCSACPPDNIGMNEVEGQKTISGPIVITLKNVGGTPLGISSDKTNNIYVSAFPHNFIDVYAPGATTPTNTLTDTQMSTIYYIATDQKGNLFADGWGVGGPGSGLQIDEFKKGSQASIKLISIAGLFPGGMTMDKTGNLYVADEGNGTGGFIGVLKPPYKTVSRSFGYSGTITGIDLDKLGNIWAANLNAGGADALQEYSKNGTLMFTSPALPAGTYSYSIAVQK